MEAILPKVNAGVVAEMMKQGIPLASPQKAIAARIPDNTVLAQFIHAIAPENRLNVYEGLVPYLGFKARPYWWLMARRKKHARKN